MKTIAATSTKKHHVRGTRSDFDDHWFTKALRTNRQIRYKNTKEKKKLKQ